VTGQLWFQNRRHQQISQKSHNSAVPVPGTFDRMALLCVATTRRRCRNQRRSWALTIALLVWPVSAMAQPESASPERQQSSPASELPAAETSSVDAPLQEPSSCGDQTKDEQEQKSGEQKKGTSDDRLFWALPNFLTVENGRDLPPLTTKQKFDVTFRSGFDEVEYGWYAILAGISQAENHEPSYAPGVRGYAERYALSFADGTIENYMVNAIFASTLHQDPRYYQLGKGSVWHRTGYSVSRIFVTRSDAGRRQFNFSEILGSAAAAGLYASYHPASDRTVAYTLTSWWSQVSYDTISIVLKEFWPDIRRKFARGSK
jgi:hypothetical protein